MEQDGARSLDSFRAFRFAQVQANVVTYNSAINVSPLRRLFLLRKKQGVYPEGLLRWFG